MKPAAWRVYAAAALPFVPLAAAAVERIPVPMEQPAEPAPAPQTGIAIPETFRQLGIESWSEVVRWAPWTASLGLSYDYQQQRLTGADGATQRYWSQLWTEDFSIQNNEISVLDPRFFTASLSLGFLLEQERQQALDKHLSENGQLVNYAFDGVFFPESAYNVNLSALRTQSTYVLPSGTVTDSRLENRSISFHMREDNLLRERELLPYFSANLRLAQQLTQQTTRSGDQTYRQDDRRDQVVLDFQNGRETSDLNFQYQYTKLDNRAYELGSYDAQTANLFYSLDSGPTLNRRWDSRLNYYSRKGRDLVSDLKTLEVNEFLTIDHSVERSSNYNYQLTRQDTAFGVVTTHSGGAQIYQQVYANLSLTGGATGIYSTLPGGTISAYGVSGNGNYNHYLPLQGHFTAALGGGYLVTQTHVPAGLVDVVDSPYTVPDAVGAGAEILLKDHNIATTSIVVVVLKGGARVPAILDTDYSIRVEGDRTSIVPNPLSAVMQPGDTLNVTYAYQVSSDAKYATTSRSGSVTVDWNWIGASFYHDESDQEPISGSDTTLLLDQRRDNAMLWLRGSWDTVQARADAALTRYDSTRLAYTEHRLDQYLSWIPRFNFQVNFSANQYRTEYKLPDHVTTGGSARLDVQWTSNAWITTGYASRRVYRDTLQPHETIDELGLKLRRTWTKLDVGIALGAQKRERGETSSLNGFVHFGAVRRF